MTGGSSSARLLIESSVWGSVYAEDRDLLRLISRILGHNVRQMEATHWRIAVTINVFVFLCASKNPEATLILDVLTNFIILNPKNLDFSDIFLIFQISTKIGSPPDPTVENFLNAVEKTLVTILEFCSFTRDHARLQECLGQC